MIDKANYIKIENNTNSKTSNWFYKNKSIIITLLTFYIISSIFISAIIITLTSYYYFNPLILDIEGEKIKNLQYFRISFNATLRLPNYTLYNLNAKSSRCSTFFKQDTELKSLTPSDITPELGYDKGHLVPAVDVLDSCSTFTMANVVPQIPCFNQRIWNTLESYIRYNYMNKDIITVPEYNLNNFVKNKYGTKIYIPIGFYKIIYDPIYTKIIYNIYLKHSMDICKQDFKKVGDFIKLPFFINK